MAEPSGVRSMGVFGVCCFGWLTIVALADVVI
jgi:hypothetical protein